MFDSPNLHEVMNLRRHDSIFAKPFTPAEMRIGLVRAQYYNSTMHHINRIAEKEGWSGEDKYTALAFYAMLQLESMTANYLNYTERLIQQPLFTSAQAPEPAGK